MKLIWIQKSKLKLNSLVRLQYSLICLISVLIVSLQWEMQHNSFIPHIQVTVDNK